MAKIQKIPATTVPNDTTTTTVPNPLIAEDTVHVAPGAAATGGPVTRFVPKIIKILTLPLLKLEEGVPVYIKFEGPTFIGKEIAEEGDKKRKEPPTMANVTNLETGELAQIMLGSVLQGILADDYPGDRYVGKGFMVLLGAKKRSKHGGAYNTYNVSEIEV